MRLGCTSLGFPRVAPGGLSWDRLTPTYMQESAFTPGSLAELRKTYPPPLPQCATAGGFGSWLAVYRVCRQSFFMAIRMGRVTHRTPRGFSRRLPQGSSWRSESSATGFPGVMRIRELAISIG